MPVRILTNKIVTLSPERAPAKVASPAQRKFSEARVRRSIFGILQENVLCSMATVTQQNRAHINHAYFCYSENLELYFLSDPTSLHCRNLLINSSMAMTIFNSAQEWGGADCGMQLFGSCSEAIGYEATLAERLYGERFGAYDNWRTNQSAHAEFRYRFYRFVPTGIKMLDEKVFGGGVFVIAAIRRAGDSK